MAHEPRAKIDLTAQTASIGTTTLAPAQGAGLYRLTYYLAATTAGSAGTVLLTIGWNDGVAQLLATSALSLATVAAGTLAQGSIVIKCAAGQLVTYATTVAGVIGNPQYSLTIRLETL